MSNETINSSDYTTLESQVLQTIDRLQPELIEVSRTIHSNPETAYQEYKASALLTSKLEENGYQVQRKAADIDTAFVAYAGDKPSPTIAILAEYDALPVIGHACGHNLMATAAWARAWACAVSWTNCRAGSRFLGHLPRKVVAGKW